MARRKTRSRRQPPRGKPAINWGSLAFGFVAGLGITVAAWLYGLPHLAGVGPAAPPVEPPLDPPAETITEAAQPPVESTTDERPRPAEIEVDGEEFDFYDLLPEQEVVVSNDFESVRAQEAAAALPITEDGTHIIQAGSFRSAQDADRMKATLALQGMRAEVVPVTVNEQRFHRVRVGPIEDLATLNEYRRRLQRARIDVMVVRVPD